MKKVKISLILNVIITLLVLLGSIFMFVGFTFMPANKVLEAAGVEIFKFYTVDSNVLVGVTSLILLIYEFMFLTKKIDNIPNIIYILKFIATSAITLTFVTTLVFLTPQYGLYAMYNNTNLIFHLIVPVLALISYIYYEKHDNKYKYAILGIIPMFIYSIYYAAMIIVNLNNDGLTIKYDFYGFLQGNINNIYIVIPIIYFISYIFSVLLIRLNKKN